MKFINIVIAASFVWLFMSFWNRHDLPRTIEQLPALADEPKPAKQRVTAATAAGDAKKPKPYFYIVAADPQLLWGQKDERNWQTTVEHINRLKPALFLYQAEIIPEGPTC